MMRVPAASGGPLNFWKEQASKYRVLSAVARRMLAILAAIRERERDFSSVGDTLTELRTRLSAYKVKTVELINWKLRAAMQSSM